MHLEARQFTERVKAGFPAFFSGGVRVLDVGSGDINGNNRFLFDPSCQYEGIDVAPGPNVNHVCAAGDFKPTESAVYDTIISTECFEHDIDFVRSFRNIVRLLKPGGLFLFTCGSTGRPEHGTARASPEVSLSSKIAKTNDRWYPNYYRNLTAEDVQRAVPLHLYFKTFSFETNEATCDLYFWGLRNARPYDAAEATVEARSQATMEAAYDGDRHPTDKGVACHRYTRQYHALFDKYRYATGVRYLEVGVFRGGSIKAVRDYMPNVTHIVGVDIDPACKQYENPDDHIYVEIGSGTDPIFMKGVLDKYGPFDIMVDDGSHVAEDVATTFELLFPYLKDGGLYIAEDTVCMRAPGFRRSPESPDHVSYFFRYPPLLNQWNMFNPHYKGPHRNAADPDKVVKAATDPFDAAVDMVTFGVSFVAVHKRVRYNWLPPTTPTLPTVQF